MKEPDSEDRRTRLDEAILGRTPDLTVDEVSASSQMSLDDTLRLWRALGFPDAGSEAAFTLDDVGAFSRLRLALESGVDEDTLVRVTRAVGSTMARLADWEVGNLLPMFEERYKDSEIDERLAAAVELVNAITPSFELLILYAWRRHLAAAVARNETLQDVVEESHVTATIGFADLVGFTQFTNEIDEDEIGTMVEVFEARCHDVVTSRRGRVIKSIGDSVL
ncbi:MAG TPA: adenylate/guanylate cyclase domain-containing protein, partial [Marmoricola sp.]